MSTQTEAAGADGTLYVAGESVTPDRRSIALPNLKEGETWAGILFGQEEGEKNKHVILIATRDSDDTHKNNAAWAEGLGGRQPNCREGRLLFINLRKKFASAWYWLGEQHPGNASYAYCQHFGYGYQYYYHKHVKLPAVAVRTEDIE